MPTAPALFILTEDRHSQFVAVVEEAIAATYQRRVVSDLGVPVHAIAKTLADNLARPVGYWAPIANDVAAACRATDAPVIAAGTTAAWLRDALGGPVRPRR